jgi:two-component system chemotaxis response regulator CheY
MADLDLSNLSALIIDDNFHMRQLVKTVLSALNLRNVAEADDGAAAIKVLKTFEADFVICDWAMSPLDGIDFTKLIRTSDDSPNIYLPIIMLSGHTEMNRIMIARRRRERVPGQTGFGDQPLSAHQSNRRAAARIRPHTELLRTEPAAAPGPELRWAGTTQKLRR